MLIAVFRLHMMNVWCRLQTAAFLRTDWEYFQRSQRVAEAANVYGVAGTTALAAIVSGNLLVRFV